ncbi:MULTISPECIES: hypothetical protein [unclassified Streptomyces]|uniref:hypothetical protein n=1 Tax=unclassified Streptomyces TaxID=2593676 RepID=UPI00380B03FE
MAEHSDSQQDVTYRAPVGSVDLKAFDDDGNSYEIHACHDCPPWHAEVVVSLECADRPRHGCLRGQGAPGPRGLADRHDSYQLENSRPARP